MVPLTICLVGCGKAKLAHAAPAKDLYTGSLFAAARRYAEECDEWRIVSALYGLVEPEREIDPYEYRLDPKDAQQWGQSVANALVYDLRAIGPYEVVLLMGEDYAHPIMSGLRVANVNPPEWRCNVVGVRAPLRGLGMGKRLAWFAEERRKDEAAARDPMLAFGVPS